MSLEIVMQNALDENCRKLVALTGWSEGRKQIYKKEFVDDNR